jgi:glutamate 5-kinase
VVETIDDSIVKLAGGVGLESVGTGGMATKIEAARLATESGTPVVIAKADVPDVVIHIVQGAPLGTKFLSHTSTKESRKRWLLSEATKGVITVDKGARAKLVNEGASLLPVGIKGVSGSFKRGQVITIVSEEQERLAVGITNYTDGEIVKIQGARSSEIETILGYTFGPEVIHRDNLVTLQ